MAPSLDDILKDLEGLDQKAVLKDIAYSKCFNHQLGTKPNSSGTSDFFVYIPYGNWSNVSQPPPTLPSQFENAIKDVIAAGCLKDDQADNTQCFIDFAHLDSLDPKFMTEHEDATQSIVQTLAKYVNQMDNSITPVIRFLSGGEATGSISTFQSNLLPQWQDIFWPVDANGQHQQLFSHPKATLYIGYHNPNLRYPNQTGLEGPQLDSKEISYNTITWLKKLIEMVLDSINAIAERQGQKAEEISHRIRDFLSTIETELDKFVAFIKISALPPIMWNHAKFVAVNGRTIVTGGANFTSPYTINSKYVWDFAIKVQGDSAITAHAFGNYIWKYLSKPHELDNSSMAFKTSLSSPKPPTISDLAPLSGGNVPLFLNGSTLKDGIPSLTVARVGDWHGGQLEWPVQILDALRDLLLQVVDGLNKAYYPSLNFLPYVVDYVSDTACVSHFAEIGVTPTAWATRRARIVAIESATHSVHMAAQALVDYFPLQSPDWQNLRDKINQNLDLSNTKGKWDGKIRPFDLLVAFSKVLARTSTQNAADETASESGIFIVLSPYGNDYGDNTTVASLTESLTETMTAMAQMGKLPEAIKPEAIPGIIKAKFLVKRLSTDITKNGLHNKTFCVDKSLLYVGSDNPYPNYNEEFGCMFDNTAGAAKDWVESYFNKLWDYAVFTDS